MLLTIAISRCRISCNNICLCTNPNETVNKWTDISEFLKNCVQGYFVFKSFFFFYGLSFPTLSKAFLLLETKIIGVQRASTLSKFDIQILWGIHDEISALKCNELHLVWKILHTWAMISNQFYIENKILYCCWISTTCNRL